MTETYTKTAVVEVEGNPGFTENRAGLSNRSDIGTRERKESRVPGLVRFLGISFLSWLYHSPRPEARRDLLREETFYFGQVECETLWPIQGMVASSTRVFRSGARKRGLGCRLGSKHQHHVEAAEAMGQHGPTRSRE